MEEIEVMRKKPGRKQKQSDALKAYKETKRKRKTNAISFAYRRILMGFEMNDIVDAVVDEYEYTKDGATGIYYKAYDIYEKQVVRESPIVITDNMKKLEAIQQEAFEKGDLQNTLKAIDMANKMVGAYTEKVSVDVGNKDGEVFKVIIE